MAIIGFIIVVAVLMHYKDHVRRRAGELGDQPDTAAPWCGHEHWGKHAQREWDRHRRRAEREARRWARRWGYPTPGTAPTPPKSPEAAAEERMQKQARRRAKAEIAFYQHLQAYLGVMAFLAFINVMTTPMTAWFLFPAGAWGLGLFFHYMGVFGTQHLKEQYFEPAVAREVQREKTVLQTEKQADISDLTSTIAHEIRNPIAAAKSLVQQMGEDPASVENVEYAKVAIEELDRVERRISHLLKYAKEEDYQFELVSIASVVDAALVQMKSKLDTAKVAAVRNYIGGPTVKADGEKLKSVFVNIIDNAIDSFADVVEGRRLDLFVENGGRLATVRIRDNGRGIPQDKIDRIFNPFFTTKDHGTGLGMAISKKIVEAHTGTLEVESTVGRGTEFQVTLPLPEK